VNNAENSTMLVEFRVIAYLEHVEQN